MKIKLIIILLFSLILLILFKPVSLNYSPPPAKPARNYEEATRKIQDLDAKDQNLNPLCKTIYMTHNKKTEKAVVFYHGITNCPQQFSKLGALLFEQGYNVFIPRLPHHGLANRNPNDLKNLTAEELINFNNEILNLASGLGDKIIVAGLSAGGVLTAWDAQNRSDVSKAIIIAPNFSPPYPTFFTLPLTNISSLSPDHFEWWDKNKKDKLAGPDYVYPGYSTHAMSEVFRLGISIKNQSQKITPQASSIIFVLNDYDNAVNNEASESLLKNWQLKNPNVSQYIFPESLKLGHDLIDPNQPYQKTDLVYPKLIELIKS